MMFQRYWRTALIAPAVGFLFGAVVFGLVTMTGNPQARTGQTIRDLAVAVLTYGTIGLVISLAALTGGVVVVAGIDRRLTKSSGARTALAAFGAAGGVLILGVVFAIVQWAIGDGGWAYLIVILSVALAIAAGIVAAILVYRVERRSERTRPQPVEHPLPSAWVDF